MEENGGKRGIDLCIYLLGMFKWRLKIPEEIILEKTRDMASLKDSELHSANVHGKESMSISV